MVNSLRGSFIWGLAALCVLLLAGCGDALGGKESKEAYSVQDTGQTVTVIPSTMQKLYWLDNERVLYSGGGAVSGHLATNGLYTWDINAKRAKRHSDINGVPCYFKGYVRYTYWRSDKTLIRREGALGNEEEIPLLRRLADGKEERINPTVASKPNSIQLNPLTCREYDLDAAAKPAGYAIEPLLDDHGYIARRHRTEEKEAPILFYKKGVDAPMTLPVLAKEFWVSDLNYSEVADKYTIYGGVPKDGKAGSNDLWPPGRSHPLYLLSPDGHVETVEIPYGPWNRFRAKYYPVKHGVFMVSHEIKGPRDSGHAGGYLVKGDQVQKVITGEITSVGVSPNGCKVAVGLHIPEKAPYPTRLHIIDFCQGE
jgi:hypothetical protein